MKIKINMARRSKETKYIVSYIKKYENEPITETITVWARNWEEAKVEAIEQLQGQGIFGFEITDIKIDNRKY